MTASLSVTPFILSACGLSRVLEKGRKCQGILASQAIVFLPCVIPFAVYALLYHSASVKNTMMTEPGLFVRDQVHSSHNMSPSNVKSS